MFRHSFWHSRLDQVFFRRRILDLLLLALVLLYRRVNIHHEQSRKTAKHIHCNQVGIPQYKAKSIAAVRVTMKAVQEVKWISTSPGMIRDYFFPLFW